MAKLEIRNIDFCKETNDKELKTIKGGVIGDSGMPLPRWLNRNRGSSLSLIFLRRRYSFATPIEIP